MRNSKIARAFERLAAFTLFPALCLSAAAAQTAGAAQAQGQAAPVSIARESELRCSGFIEHQPPANRLEVVGAEQEQEQHVFAEGDYLYINGGRQQGVSEGQEFSVVRPRGRFSTRFSRKRGTLGMYTQEVGTLRVVRVKDNASVALVTATCDNILFGDLLRAAPQRTSPIVRADVPLDRFAEPTGKQQGRIVLARDEREVLAKDQVVFIDLGTEDSVRPGDHLTVYRPLGKGSVTRFNDKEVAPGGSGGFESEVFRGGKFSTQAQRVKDPVDGHYRSVTNTPEVKGRRPALPRKIVGELVVISVEARTAAAVITRAAQEIHTGDFVEVR